MKTSMGLAYFAPNMQFSDEMPLPSPDHEKKSQEIFDRMRSEDPTKYQQYEITFRCNSCGNQVTEIHDDPTSGLVQRFCGSCGHTRLQLVSYKGLWPEGKF